MPKWSMILTSALGPLYGLHDLRLGELEALCQARPIRSSFGPVDLHFSKQKAPSTKITEISDSRDENHAAPQLFFQYAAASLHNV
jgi:hypothetical protein